jgi:hypothetical protein
MPWSKVKTEYRCTKAAALTTLGTASWLALAATSYAAEKALLDANVATEQAVEFDVYLPLRDRGAAEALLTQNLRAAASETRISTSILWPRPKRMGPGTRCSAKTFRGITAFTRQA